MTYLNPICADAGTQNCPCPLAETGDCLVCSRLAGRSECDCRWAGVCIYNEYIQNGSKIRTKRQNRSTAILQRLWHGDDLMLLQLRVPRGAALEASQPGSFLFLKAPEAPEMTGAPVSVMSVDMEHGTVWVALRILSAKTKALAACEDFLEVRGVYHSGFLGKGLVGMQEDVKSFSKPGGASDAADKQSGRRWLILTRGAGFAPAVNLTRWAAGKVSIHMISDPEYIGEDVIRQQLEGAASDKHSNPKADSENSSLRLEFCSLAKLLDRLQAASPELPHRSSETTGAAADPSHRPPLLHETDYDRIFLLASDYYIKRLAAVMNIPPEKLVFCNNFHMCCGEGICGACGHVDAEGNLRKMCKCREFSALDLLLPE